MGPEEGVPLGRGPDALVCLVEDHGVPAHLLQHSHRLDGVLPLCPHLCNNITFMFKLLSSGGEGGSIVLQIS